MLVAEALSRPNGCKSRVYQQTFIDTYAKVGFAKLYDVKTAITAGCCCSPTSTASQLR